MLSGSGITHMQQVDVIVNDPEGVQKPKPMDLDDEDEEAEEPEEANDIPDHLKATYKPPPPERSGPSPLPPVQNPAAHLRKSAHAFAVAFASPNLNPVRFVDRFLTQTGSGPTIIEHAPSYAGKPLPYLNRTFQGRSEAIEFLTARLDTLRVLWFDGSVPADDCIVVDPECRLDANKSSWKYDVKGAVCIVCKVQTEHLDSGWKWNETLVYKLTGFDEDGRFVQWDIWSDTLSAWSAAKDKALQNERNGSPNENGEIS